MQPQITVALCLAEGTSMVTEGVWDNRYRYVGELTRMGAQIRVEGRSAVIEGVDHLTAASVQAYDLRAGAAMVIAALAAEGTSEVSNVHYIERGYEDIIGKLRNLGAQIDSVECDETVETRQIGWFNQKSALPRQGAFLLERILCIPISTPLPCRRSSSPWPKRP